MLPDTRFETIISQFNREVAGITSLATLDNLRAKYIGKNGLLNTMFRQLTHEQKAQLGQKFNTLKHNLENSISQKETLLSTQQELIDVTTPGREIPLGYLHIITQTIKEIEDIFNSLGFVRRRYREIENDWYYAEGLNIPKNHPARDDQETFYVDENTVLTAHTSNGQLREMELVKNPPIRMINIGKTYRRQSSNRHSSMFHQFEGLLIDRNINITHLIGTTNYFVNRFFGPDRKIRLRPHHFQFTEPSFEVDINCSICLGQGTIRNKKCKVCKSGWLELGGAGMVHPQVLINGKVDPNIYSGFAFGWGVERVLMMKHQSIDNLRDIYLQDLRYLRQN